MLQFLKTDYDAPTLNLWLLILRLIIAAFMFTHGIPKLEKLLGDTPIAFSDPLGVSKPVSLGLAVFGEFGCSILLAMGLFSRFAAFALSFTMFVAAFLAQADAPFAKRELALVFLLIYITFLVTGPGKYSIDARLWHRGKTM